MRSYALYFAALFALIVDQATKIGVIFGLDLVNLLRIDVAPPLLNFRYGENRGSTLDCQRWWRCQPLDLDRGLTGDLCCGVHMGAPQSCKQPDDAYQCRAGDWRRRWGMCWIGCCTAMCWTS